MARDPRRLGVNGSPIDHFISSLTSSNAIALDVNAEYVDGAQLRGTGHGEDNSRRRSGFGANG